MLLGVHVLTKDGVVSSMCCSGSFSSAFHQACIFPACFWTCFWKHKACRNAVDYSTVHSVAFGALLAFTFAPT